MAQAKVLHGHSAKLSPAVNQNGLPHKEFNSCVNFESEGMPNLVKNISYAWNQIPSIPWMPGGVAADEILQSTRTRSGAIHVR